MMTAGMTTMMAKLTDSKIETNYGADHPAVVCISVVSFSERKHHGINLRMEQATSKAKHNNRSLKAKFQGKTKRNTRAVAETRSRTQMHHGTQFQKRKGSYGANATSDLVIRRTRSLRWGEGLGPWLDFMGFTFQFVPGALLTS
jgi:hypothetical protein